VLLRAFEEQTMQLTKQLSLMGAAVFLSPCAMAATDADLVAIRAQIEQLRNEYETKIQALEKRLNSAEQAVEAAEASAAKAEAATAKTAAEPEPSPPSTQAVTSGTGFNPQISVILDGNYYNDDVEGAGTEILTNVFRPSGGHAHEHDEEGHGHGETEQGFNVRATEFVFSGAVDPYFDATARFVVADEDIETEEVYFNTRSLPAGLRLKGGKFKSDFGYINRQHPHQWDFVDQNLAYLNLLGEEGLTDKGVQLTWLPAWPVYTRFGLEAFQGEQERFGSFIDDEAEREDNNLSAREEGPRLFVGYVNLAPDIGYDKALRLGASLAYNSQHQEIHHEPAEHALEGDATLWGLDAVLTHDAPRDYGAGDWKLQAEYLYEIKDLEVMSGPEAGNDLDFKTDGLYVQGWYGFAPRWQLGLRYDVLGLTNEVSGAENADFDSSDRWTAALTWSPTEFSRFRLQWATAHILSNDEGDKEDFNYLYLQYILSLGTHGAHSF
jgi:hypothetical protein